MFSDYEIKKKRMVKIILIDFLIDLDLIYSFLKIILIFIFILHKMLIIFIMTIYVNNIKTI